MKRKELQRQMRDARTPNEIATALSAAREWLGDHPEDGDVGLAIAEVLQVERNVLPAL